MFVGRTGRAIISGVDRSRSLGVLQAKVGFDRVNQHVKHAMIQWIGVVVREKFEQLVDAADDQESLFCV